MNRPKPKWCCHEASKQGSDELSNRRVLYENLMREHDLMGDGEFLPGLYAAVHHSAGTRKTSVRAAIAKRLRHAESLIGTYTSSSDKSAEPGDSSMPQVT